MKYLLVFLGGVFVALCVAYVYLVWIFNRNRS